VAFAEEGLCNKMDSVQLVVLEEEGGQEGKLHQGEEIQMVVREEVALAKPGLERHFEGKCEEQLELVGQVL